MGSRNKPSDQSQKTPNSRIWIASEFYYPEDNATGYYLTGIAEGLAQRFNVSVLCAQPTYSEKGYLPAKTETVNGVKIRRCWSTRFSKDHLPLRLINMLTITTVLFWNAVLRFRKGGRVMVVTNPPLLPFAVGFAAKLRGCKLYLLLHDVYPEAVAAAGLISKTNLLYRLGTAATRRLYRSADQIIVLGRDMRQLVEKKAESKAVEVIENWADTLEIYPCPRDENYYRQALDLKGKRVILYSGNLGRTHSLQTLLEAAHRLRDNNNIHFLIVGDGAKKLEMLQTAENLDLQNVTFMPRQPREKLRDLQNAGDMAIISFMPGMKGISVPSRMYNMMAAGKPIVALTSRDHELGQTILENDAGWVIETQQPESLARLVAETPESEIVQKGENARKAAVDKYSYEKIMSKYFDLFGQQPADQSNPITKIEQMKAKDIK